MSPLKDAGAVIPQVQMVLEVEQDLHFDRSGHLGPPQALKCL